MQVTLVTPAQGIPCSHDLALRHIRALTDDIDLVDFYVRAATAACEEYTGRIFVQQIFKVTLGAWPQLPTDLGIVRRQREFQPLYGVCLPRSPLVAINSVKYWPAGGGGQVEMAEASYLSDRAALPGRVIFPGDLPDVDTTRPDAIEIEFEAGHGTHEHEMPMQYLLAMLQLARHYMDNPGVLDMEGKARVMPYSYQHLLRSQKI